MARVRPLEWREGRLRILDQTLLPHRIAYLETEDWREVVRAIREMRVRGAPAIGLAGAYALALAGRHLDAPDRDGWLRALEERAREIASARPTAVNLAWAVEQALANARSAPTVEEGQRALLETALRLHREQEEADRAIGQHGAGLVPEGAVVLTHCNTGALATGGLGTALAVVRQAWTEGRLRGVVATETRPLLQGARLTAWELAQEGIPVTLVVEGAVGLLMARRRVNCVLVGADRVARNGDTANKVGTYPLAVLAHRHGIPFYVALPLSTLDPSLPSGEAIPIEERAPEEVTRFAGVPTAPEGVPAWNPAFDVTPADLITAFITERGVVRPPFEKGLTHLLQGGPAPAPA